MRFWITWLILMSLGITGIKGCEICGCGIGGSMFGLLTQNRKSYCGFRYHTQTFRVTHPPSFAEPALPEHFRETFSMGELWGMISASKRLSVIGMLPYRMYVRHASAIPLASNGVGDLSIAGQYTITPKADSIIHQVTWWMNSGLGLIFPTGTHHSGNSALLPAQMPGSGMWQLSAFINATLRYRNTGIIVEADWRKPFMGDGFQQESRRVGISGFRNIQSGANRILPFAGTSVFRYGTDDDAGFRTDYLWNLAAGLQVNVGNVIVGVHSEIPLHQRFSSGSVTALPRWQFQAGYTF